MSLLIKALDKAQNAKAEQAQAEKSKKDQADNYQVEKTQANKKQVELEIEPDASNKPQSTAAQRPIKNTNKDVELSLSPAGREFSETTINIARPASKADVPMSAMPVTTPAAQPSSSQYVAAKNAANVFSAKGLEAKTDSARLIMIAGAGLIALLGMGLYFYQFVDSSPPILLPPRPVEQMAATPADVTSTENVLPANALEAASLALAPLATEPVMTRSADSVETKPTASSNRTKESALINEGDSLFAAEANAAEDSLTDENAANETALNDSMQADDRSNRLQASFSANKANKQTRKSRSNASASVTSTSVASASIGSKSASINVTKSTPQPSVSPTLMSAYDAYNAGRDVEAQALYKQVLKRDIHNVDALLGLGTIALRQGRNADANGWYAKVLEADPRNTIAKTAMLDSNLISNQSQGNQLSTETSLKNMLAKRPDDANLYVALGNLYAEQNQWPAAQQAYFDAYSLNKSTDNAYNLAVSLDQIGKPKLALPYYQQALQQATDASNIDKAALQARINAIQ